MGRRLQRALAFLQDAYPKHSPAFFGVGATRSGTTFLHALLAQHSQIFMPRTKELHYFNDERLYRPDLAGYYRLFDGYGGEPVYGEITPLYLMKGALYGLDGKLTYGNNISAIDRIAEHFPDAKIIVSLRDPIGRIASSYEKGLGQGKFTVALEDRLRTELGGMPSSFGLIYGSRYDIHLKHVLSRFSRDKVKVLIFEEWTRDVPSTYATLQSFLDLDQELYTPPPREALNRREQYAGKANTSAAAHVSPAVFDELAESLKPAIDFVTRLVGHELPWTSVSSRISL